MRKLFILLCLSIIIACNNNTLNRDNNNQTLNKDTVTSNANNAQSTTQQEEKD